MVALAFGLVAVEACHLEEVRPFIIIAACTLVVVALVAWVAYGPWHATPERILSFC